MKNALKNMLKRFKNEDGSVLVVSAAIFAVLLSFCAIVVDVGIAYMEKSSLQAAVDAGALAGASAMPDQNLATYTAKQYLIKNGFSDENIEITFPDGNKIKVQSSKDVDTLFAGIFDRDKVYYGASACAVKEVKGLGGPFDYLLFSGSETATLNLGGSFGIYGSVHSNGSFSASPSYGLITGSVEARNSLYINTSTTTVGTLVPNALSIPMVDFSSVVAQNIPTSFSTVLSATSVNSVSSKQYFSGNTKITGNCTIKNQAVINGNLYVEGDLVISGGSPACELNGSIYATGKITFGNTFKGKGCVMAKSDILCQGGGMILDANSPVCLYSELGNIGLTTATSAVSGIVYAPNGTVNIQGGTTTFCGSIIGNKISGMPANLQMRSPTSDFPFFGGKTYIHLVE